MQNWTSGAMPCSACRGTTSKTISTVDDATIAQIIGTDETADELAEALA